MHCLPNLVFIGWFLLNFSEAYLAQSSASPSDRVDLPLVVALRYRISRDLFRQDLTIFLLTDIKDSEVDRRQIFSLIEVVPPTVEQYLSHSLSAR